MKQLGVKFLVEGIAIVSKRFLEQMLCGKNLVEIYKFTIIDLIRIGDCLFKVFKIKICTRNFFGNYVEVLGRNMLVEMFGIVPVYFPIVIFFSELRIAENILFKPDSIENKPFPDICCNEMFKLVIVLINGFTKIIQYQFLQCFYIGFPLRNHLKFITGMLCLDTDADRIGRRLPAMNNQVGSLFGVDIICVLIICFP